MSIFFFCMCHRQTNKQLGSTQFSFSLNSTCSFLLIQSHMLKWNELELNCVLSMLLTKIFWLFTLVWDSVHFGKYNIEKFHNISFIRIGFCVLFIVIVLCYIISMGDFLLLFQWNHIMEQYWPEITENLSKPFLWVDSFKAF